jgi:phytoene dehydrogenase-like protein
MTDALIIGSGHNGLAAAIALAKRGKKVTVLEARAAAGGLCASREFHAGFTVPGIFHDTSEVRPQLLDALGLLQHGAALRDAEVPVHAPSATGKGLLLWNDAEKSADELGEDAAGYRELVRIVDRARAPVLEALNTAPPALVPDALSEYFDLAKVGLSLRRMGAKDLYALLRLLPMCLGDLMRDHFKSEAVMAAIAGQSLLSEYAGPWSAGTSARWFLSRIAAGKEVAGGPAALVRALEKSLAAAGGTVRTNAKVATLLVEKGKIAGAKLVSGEELKAPLVGFAANPRLLLDLLPPHAFPLKVFEELMAVRSRGTSAKVHLALDAPIATRGRNEIYERLRISESLDELERAFDSIKYRQLSSRPALDIRQPSVADASLAPKGKHVASIWVHFAPHDVEGGWTDARRGAVLDSVLARIEKYDADIRKKVLASEVLDPGTLEKEFNLPGGNVHHGEMVLDQLLFMRPTLRLAHYVTPLEGLFLCGSGSHPGGGVTLAPGALGAQAALSGAWK